MGAKIRTLITELKVGLKAIYGPRLRGVYLYAFMAEEKWLRGDTPFLANVCEGALAA